MLFFLGMIAIGAGTGLLIGLTGIGSGSLLTPLLLLVGGMSPAEAVGTSLVFSFLTKLYGSWSFLRRGLVEGNLARRLIFGAVPGVAAGALVLGYLQLRPPEVMNQALARTIGAALLGVSGLMLIRLLPPMLRPAVAEWQARLSHGQRNAGIVLIGFGVGLCVSLTSIGSGVALIPAIVLFYKLDAGKLVGTSVLLGTILAAVAGTLHASWGHVEWQAVGALLCGSLPAMALATRMHGRVPRGLSEALIAAALAAAGVRILLL